MLVEIRKRHRLAEPLEIIVRRIDVEMNREETTLDEIGLGRSAQADGYIGLAHGQIEFLVVEDQFDTDIRVEVEKLPDALSEPDRAQAHCRRDLQVA